MSIVSVLFFAAAAGLFFLRPVRVAFATIAGLYLLAEIGILVFVPLLLLVLTNSPIIAITVALIGIGVVLTPIFPVPLKNKVFVGAVTVSMTIGFVGMFLGEDFLSSLSGYRKAFIGKEAADLNIGEEGLKTYELKKGTALYEQDGDKVQLKGYLQSDVEVRLRNGIVEAENSVKYRRVLFPVFIEGIPQKGVFDNRSSSRLVTPSSLGRAISTSIHDNGGGTALGSKGQSKSLIFWLCLLAVAAGIVWIFVKAPADTRSRGLVTLVIVVVAIAAVAFVLFSFGEFVRNTVYGDNVVYNTVTEPPPAQRDQFGPERLIDFGTGEISQNELVIMTFDQEVKKVKVTRTIHVASLEQGRAPAIDFGQGALIFVPGTKEPKNRFLPGRLSGRKGGVFLPAETEIVFGSGQREIKAVFRDERPGKLFTQHTVGCREVR